MNNKPVTLFGQIYVAQSEAEAELVKRLHEGGVPLNLIQALIVAALADKDPFNNGLKPSELSGMCGRVPTSFTPGLDSIDKQFHNKFPHNLIERKPNPTDRRSVLIYLTSEGKRVALTVLEIVRSIDIELKGVVKSWNLK